MGFALSNLSVIAMRQQDYASALRYGESAIAHGQSFGGRIGMIRSLSNDAELRLRLGLVEHAEHAVAFGLRLLSGGAATALMAHFHRIAAEIALARGRIDVARTAIEAALGDATAVGDREVLVQAWLVSARVSLDEGDLTCASDALDRASDLTGCQRERAELAILRASVTRGRGEDARELAEHAVERATEVKSRHCMIEAHSLAARVHAAVGDRARASHHAARAMTVCDQVAASLPDEIRAVFLSRSRLAALVPRDAAGFPPPEVVPPPRSGRVRHADEPRQVVGTDPAIRSLLLAVRRVARSNGTVLVRGESGTGKELVAEEIHRQSPRASGPLVSVNCAALVDTLLISELFGHERGAFTGASARRRGRFEMAEGGTLFLDEIGDVSPKTQVALLRVLQEKTFERVGGTSSIRSDVRVVCATHRDLKRMVERGEFREDLYYRLAEITLEIPALRDRLGDLPEIARHVLERIATERGEREKTLSPSALRLLGRHAWPGNVRELENVLRAVSLFVDGDEITHVDLVENVEELRPLAQTEPTLAPRMTARAPELAAGVSLADEGEALEPPSSRGATAATAAVYAQVRSGSLGLSELKRIIEHDCILRALTETKGNITRAALLLGMKRPRLSQLAKAYGITGTQEGT